MISRHAKVAAPVPCVIYGSFIVTDVINRTANAATTANTAFAANRGEVEINSGYIGQVISYFGLEMSGLLSASGATFLHYWGCRCFSAYLNAFLYFIFLKYIVTSNNFISQTPIG